MGRSILPTLKENKRYIQITALNGNINVNKLKNTLKEYMGFLGYTKAGVNYPKNNIIRCNSSSLTNVKAGLALSEQQIIINNVSGNIGRVK